MTGVGVVAIGKNEGERFRRCLASLRDAACVVYVDSGSTDGSIEAAEEAGAHVVRLDMSSPFTASRARNAGFARLREVAPQITLVQFVDGDCEIDMSWLATGERIMREDERVAVLSGRLREIAPQASLFNRLADLEWNKPVGDQGHCGGNALMRVEAIARAGGFDESLLAGEEPDLCERVRAQGGVVRRVAHEMARHDLAMLRFSQWWTRQRKGGYGSADVTFFGPRVSRAIFRKAVLSAAAWGLVMPLASVALIVIAWWWRGPMWGGVAAVGCVALWLLQSLRIARSGMRKGLNTSDALAYGLLTMLSKIAYVQGGTRNVLDRLLRRGPATINYKGAASSAPQEASHAA